MCGSARTWTYDVSLKTIIEAVLFGVILYGAVIRKRRVCDACGGLAADGVVVRAGGFRYAVYGGQNSIEDPSKRACWKVTKWCEREGWIMEMYRIVISVVQVEM
ncbi:hypothetical protein CHUAL_006318 [Chamberlinius hualienensis]